MVWTVLTGKPLVAFVSDNNDGDGDDELTGHAPSDGAESDKKSEHDARPRTRSGSLSTPDAKPQRKRSLDNGASAPSEKKAKSAAPSAAAKSSKPKPAVEVVDEDDAEDKEYAKHPIYTVPTHWEELYNQQVEIIHIDAPGARDRIHALRFAGTPFVLEGHTGWMKFSDGWVTPDGTLDTDTFLRGIHDVKVPVIERNYEETNPIKTHLPLGHYVKNYWEQGKAEYYMHQWQFPLNPKVAKTLCYKCEELPVIGDNLLLYWLDAVRGACEGAKVSRLCSYKCSLA